MTQPSPVRDLDVERASQGDESAFERLYHRHVARTHGLARRLLGSTEEADEATQEIFLRAWRNLPSFRGEALFSTWLHRLARNLLLNRIASGRAAKRAVEFAPVEVESTPAPGSGVRGDRVLDIESALGDMSPKDRAVLVLFDIEGHDHREIAEALGLSVSASKSRLHRARARLRSLLSSDNRRDHATPIG